MTITACSSANFYQKVNEIADNLTTAGFEVFVPETATAMKRSGDYDVSHYKTWFGDANDYPKKARLMQAHFDKIAESDAILVVNEVKHGIENYIGGNVLMEMAIAFHLGKPIYIYNGLPAESAYVEELRGMLPILLNGDLGRIRVGASD